MVSREVVTGGVYHACMDANLLPFPYALPPQAPGLVLDDAEYSDCSLAVTLRSTAPTAACPLCRRLSARVHSQYRRTLTDLPWGGHAVVIALRVRKFFCAAPWCSRRIFTERLPALVAPYARKTSRLADLLRAIAFALGGEAGARLARGTGIAVSPATLIAVIRRSELPAHPPPRVLGVDDWARRKGVRYGTALVDLERHRLIDLLPDRTPESLARWLQAHPGTEVVARDRSEAYATGARQGAPAAVHVADRWHLLSNWREAVERVLNRYRGHIKRVSIARHIARGESAETVLPAKSANRRRKYAEERRARARDKRHERYTLIRERHAKGEYLTTIARDLGLNYKTVRKYALADECPAPNPYPPRRRVLEPYEPYVRARWAEGCRNGNQLYRELVEHGFRGSRPLVAALVARLRRTEGEPTPSPRSSTNTALTPHAAAALLIRPAERCDDAEREAIERLRACHPDVATTIEFTERFAEIVRERRGDRLDRWLATARASGIREIERFALKLSRDEAAVRAGCTLEWSNGQTEGQITRLKAIKRSMYGRGKFDLLRQRALYAA